MQLDLWRELNDPAWRTEMDDRLDDDARAAVVAVLARLMAKAMRPQEDEDE